MKNPIKQTKNVYSKTMIKRKLKKYNFSEKRIADVFAKRSDKRWKLDIDWIKWKIKEVEESYEELYYYTEMSKEIWSLLYEALIWDK